MLTVGPPGPTAVVCGRDIVTLPPGKSVFTAAWRSWWSVSVTVATARKLLIVYPRAAARGTHPGSDWAAAPLARAAVSRVQQTLRAPPLGRSSRARSVLEAARGRPAAVPLPREPPMIRTRPAERTRASRQWVQTGLTTCDVVAAAAAARPVAARGQRPLSAASPHPRTQPPGEATHARSAPARAPLAASRSMLRLVRPGLRAALRTRSPARLAADRQPTPARPVESATDVGAQRP